MAHGHGRRHIHSPHLEERDDHPANLDGPTTEKAQPTEPASTIQGGQTTAGPTIVTASDPMPTATTGDMTAITFATDATGGAPAPSATSLDGGSAPTTGSSPSEVLSGSSASPTSSASNSSSSSGGISGGAKAGAAIGVIFGVGLIAGLIIFWLRKRKQSKQPVGDNEKTVDDFSPLAPSSADNSKTLPDPPKLQVRPVTEFAPDLTSIANSSIGGAGTSGNTLTVGAAVASGDARNVADSNIAPGTAVTSAAAVGSAAAASHNLTEDQPEHHPNRGFPHSPFETPPKDSDIHNDPFGDPVNPFDNLTEASPPSITVMPPAPPVVSESPELARDTPREEQPEPNGAKTDSAPEAAAAGPAVSGIAAATTAAAASANGQSKADRPERQENRTPSPTNNAVGPSSPTSASSVDSVSISPDNTAGVAAIGPGPSNVHRVQMDFNPSMEDELGLRCGQLVRLLHEYDDGWALCVRLDRSQQGVAPKTCLSSRPVKPRSRAPRRGMPIMISNDPRIQPGPMGPPPSFRPPPTGRPMSPAGPRFPIPMQNSPHYQRPMSPAAQFPAVPRSQSPAPGNQHRPFRSQSPGPYRAPRSQNDPMPTGHRPRSNSASGAIKFSAANGQRNLSSLAGPASPPPLTQPPAVLPASSPAEAKGEPVPHQPDA